MPLVKGKLTLSVWETPPLTAIDAAAIIEGMEGWAFKEVEDSKEISQGFTTSLDLYNTSFEEHSTFLDNTFMFAGIRIDKKKIPPIVLKQEFKREMKDYYSRNPGLNRKLNKSEKEVIKEQAIANLLPKTIPTPKMTEFIYNWKKGVIYLNSSSKDFIHIFPVAFEKLFGVVPELKEAKHDPYNFVDWLFYQSLSTDTAFEIEDNLVLKDADRVVTFSNVEAQSGAFVDTFKNIPSIASSKVKLLGDTHFSCVLNNKDPFIKGLTLPKIDEEELEDGMGALGVLFERVGMVEEFYSKLSAIYAAYDEFKVNADESDPSLAEKIEFALENS